MALPIYYAAFHSGCAPSAATVSGMESLAKYRDSASFVAVALDVLVVVALTVILTLALSGQLSVSRASLYGMTGAVGGIFLLYAAVMLHNKIVNPTSVTPQSTSC